MSLKFTHAGLSTLRARRRPSVYRGMTLVMLLLDIFECEQLLAPPYKTMIDVCFLLFDLLLCPA